MEIKIRKAGIEDAPFLAETVMKAIGDELSDNLGGGAGNLHRVRRLFTELASSKDSQYSYTNALIAENEEGTPAGAVIAYDGARLRTLRRSLLLKANELLGWNVTEEETEQWEDEAGPNEFYIDSLYVREEFRNHGIASALIFAVMDGYKEFGKPFGILVEPENTVARRLYEKLGFHKDGVNHFCGVPMDHLTIMELKA